MKEAYKYITLCVAAVLGVASCIYPFTPEEVPQEIGLLVMEGEINAGIESSFTASESFSILAENVKAKSLELSDIYVESESGKKYASYRTQKSEDYKFEGDSKLSYIVDTRALDKEERHKLVFSCRGKKYETVWLEFVETPVIDSITYRVADDKSKLDIMVHATGISDSLRYFKWEYREDWEFHAVYQQQFILVDQVPVILPPGVPDNYYCWNKAFSSDINLLSTAGLSENRVKDHLLTSIGSTNKRLMDLYSIEVYQKGISEEAYKYWDTMLKNNEGTGGIFAPQPNELRGNIYCIDDPEEMVLGYITSCEVEKMRIYIKAQDHNIYKNPEDCTPFQWFPNPDKGEFEPSPTWGVYFYDEETGDLFYVEDRCLTCLRHGTKDKPDFWPTKHE